MPTAASVPKTPIAQVEEGGRGRVGRADAPPSASTSTADAECGIARPAAITGTVRDLRVAFAPSRAPTTSSERLPLWASQSPATMDRCATRTGPDSQPRHLPEPRPRALSLRTRPAMLSRRPCRRPNARSTTARCASSGSARTRRSIRSIACPSSPSCDPRVSRRCCRPSGRSRQSRGDGRLRARNRRALSRTPLRTLRPMLSRPIGSIRVLSKCVHAQPDRG